MPRRAPATIRGLLSGIQVDVKHPASLLRESEELLALAKAKEISERTVREFMSVLSLCDQVDLWRYGRSAGLAVLG